MHFAACCAHTVITVAIDRTGAPTENGDPETGVNAPVFSSMLKAAIAAGPPEDPVSEEAGA